MAMILALLDLEGTPAAPNVLVAVGMHVLRLDDLRRLMRRRGPCRSSSLLLALVSRLFVDERLREAFWPTWLDVQNIDKFDEGEWLGSRRMCMGWCGRQLEGAISACACAIPITIMLDLECERCVRGRRPHSVRHLIRCLIRHSILRSVHPLFWCLR